MHRPPVTPPDLRSPQLESGRVFEGWSSFRRDDALHKVLQVAVFEAGADHVRGANRASHSALALFDYLEAEDRAYVGFNASHFSQR